MGVVTQICRDRVIMVRLSTCQSNEALEDRTLELGGLWRQLELAVHCSSPSGWFVLLYPKICLIIKIKLVKK